MPVLIVSSPGRPERSFRFARRALVGRDPAADLQLQDPAVSAFHAVLHLDEAGALCVSDLRSSNGSHLDGALVSRATLRVGSTLALGASRLVVSGIEWQSGSRRPSAASDDPEVTSPVAGRGHSISPEALGARRAWGDLAALYELGDLLEVGRSEAEVHRAVAELVARATGAQRVCLVGWDAATDRATTLFAWPDGADMSGGRPWSRSIIDEVIHGGETVLVPDVSLSADLRHAPSIAVNAIRSALCAPMHGRDGITGMILATHHEPGFEFLERQIRLMTAVGQAVGKALENHQLYWRLDRSFVGTLAALAQALDARDPYTAGHSQRVTDLSLVLGRQLALDEARVRALRLGALLHDVGKIGVEDACLRAARALSPDELEHVRRHPDLGGQILAPLDALREVCAIVRHHHERWDGRGYPDGLAGPAIPLQSRVIAVADAIDAITSDRPYRRASPFDLALHEVRHGRGSQFDPAVVDALERALRAGDLAGAAGRAPIRP